MLILFNTKLRKQHKINDKSDYPIFIENYIFSPVAKIIPIGEESPEPLAEAQQ
jgi:hypothetical protein